MDENLYLLSDSEIYLIKRVLYRFISLNSWRKTAFIKECEELFNKLALIRET